MTEEQKDRVANAMTSFRNRLRDAGLKSTRQRDLIVETFFRLDKHINPDELLAEVRKAKPTIGYATVYRTLKLLVEQDLAVPKNFGDGQTRFDPIHGQDPQHDHLICVTCRKIIEFNDAQIAERLAAVSEDLGFNLLGKKLEIYAECVRENCPNKPE